MDLLELIGWHGPKKKKKETRPMAPSHPELAIEPAGMTISQDIDFHELLAGADAHVKHRRSLFSKASDCLKQDVLQEEVACAASEPPDAQE
jgi:hypothetical protein